MLPHGQRLNAALSERVRPPSRNLEVSGGEVRPHRRLSDAAGVRRPLRPGEAWIVAVRRGKTHAEGRDK